MTFPRLSPYRRFLFFGTTLSLIVSTSALCKELSSAELGELRKMASVYQMINSEYVRPVDRVSVLASCMKGMLNSLDGQSMYLDREDFEAQVKEPSGDLVGIGVELGFRAGLPTVVAAVEGSPAASVGLRPKDYILEIDGQPLEDREIKEALRALQGRPGTQVRLTIRRPGELESRILTVVRAPVAAKGIASRMVSKGIGYLRIPSFKEQTAYEVRAEFRKLLGAGPLRGLVLDLRNSPGGLLESSIEVAAMFLTTNAPVVSTEGRLPESNQAWVANRDKLSSGRSVKQDDWPEQMKTVPLTVLINGGTASGSEIVAAALKDNDRAHLIGSKTFGRGTIQTVRMLDSGTAIKLTTAVFKTPSGRQLAGQGLDPDESAPDLLKLEDAGTDKDEGLRRAMDWLRIRS